MGAESTQQIHWLHRRAFIAALGGAAAAWTLAASSLVAAAETELLGELSLKGLRNPVRAHNVVRLNE